MKGSSYSLRVMKNARTKSSHLHEQQLLGASSLAAATLHTIASRGPTPVQSPEEVSITLNIFIMNINYSSIKYCDFYFYNYK